MTAVDKIRGMIPGQRTFNNDLYAEQRGGLVVGTSQRENVRAQQK